MADVGNLIAKLTLDTAGFEKGISGVERMASNLAGGIGKVLGGVTTAVAGAVAAAGAGVVAIVKQSVEAYGEYEQLVGGAQKIFDEMNYEKIAEDAANAWKTMNLSASQYLAMINQVGASFSQTMGDEKGYETAKVGMQAIADYASGTGRNVEELNTKFAMITRSASSYQSIADQFSGILPATSADFLQAAQSAGFLSDSYKKITEVPIAEYQEAVSKMLEKGVADLNLTGNTAAETERTITGSIAGLKAAVQNLMTGLSDSGADLQALMNDVVTQAQKTLENLIPVIEQALYGISDLVAGLAPVILDAVPELIANVLPGLIEAAVSLVYSLIDAVPEIMAVLAGAIPDIVAQLLDVTANLLTMLMTDGLPMLLELAVNVLLVIAEGIVNNLPNLIPALISMLQYMIETLVINLPLLIDAALQILLALATALVDNEEQLFLAITELVLGGAMTIIYHLPEFLELGVQIVLKLVEGILMAIPNFLAAVGEMLGIVDSADKSVKKSTNSMETVVKKASISVSDFSTQAAKSTAISAQTVSQNAEKSKELVTNALNGLEQNFLRAEQISRRYFFELEIQIENAIQMLTRLGDISISPRIDPSGIVSACNSIVEACNRAIAALDKLASKGGGSFGGGHASGGWMSAGTTYLVGELGPELVTPTRSGYVHTADETADILGESSGLTGGITINIQGDVYDDERSMRNKLQDAVISVLQEQVAYA